MKKVSYTAQWTAAARALESERSDPLFDDHLARPLAAPYGFELLEKYGGGGLQEFVALRTQYFDEAIAQATFQGQIRQIIIVAAGMDARAYRLSWPENSIVYEVDYAELHAEKQQRLLQLQAMSKVDRRIVVADLNSEWLSKLSGAGFDNTQPTLWVVESLLFFLSDDQVKKLFKGFTSVSCAGSKLIVDVLSKDLLNYVGTQPFLHSLREAGIPWTFGTNDPANYFGALGWDLTDLKEPGEAGAGAERWPYPVFPRDCPNIPRNW